MCVGGLGCGARTSNGGPGKNPRARFRGRSDSGWERFRALAGTTDITETYTGWELWVNNVVPVLYRFLPAISDEPVDSVSLNEGAALRGPAVHNEYRTIGRLFRAHYRLFPNAITSQPAVHVEL